MEGAGVAVDLERSAGGRVGLHPTWPRVSASGGPCIGAAVVDRVAGHSRREHEKDAEADERRPQGEASEAGKAETAGALGPLRCAARSGSAADSIIEDSRWTTSINLDLSAARGPPLSDRRGEHVDRRGHPAQALGADRAAGEMLDQGVALGWIESVEGVGREIVVPAVGMIVVVVAVCLHVMVAHVVFSTPSGVIDSAIWTLIFSRPSRMRPFTVPSGMLSISAISEWLKPPK